MSNGEQEPARLLSARDIGWLVAGESRVFLFEAGDGWQALRDELIREVGLEAQRQIFARAGFAATERFIQFCLQRDILESSADGVQTALNLLTAGGYGQCLLEECRLDDGWAVVVVRNSVEGESVHQSRPESGPACDYLRGLLRGIIHHLRRADDSDASEVECVETACLASGEGECRFAVGPPAHLLARGYRIGAGSGNSVRETLLRLNRQMEDVLEASQKDALTGIYNRAYFESALRNRIEFANRRTDTLAVALIDLDRFKSVNDTRGHGMGDLVLRRVAHLLASQARDTDVVARYGGDEFALLMPGTSVAAALAVADRIRALVSESPQLAAGEIGPVPLTLSIGIAACPDDATRLPVLIELADAAMYRAKEEGGNRVIRHAARASAAVSPPNAWGARLRILRGPRRPEVSPAKRRRRPS